MKQFFKKVIVKILIFESKIVLKKYKPKVVTLTGSVGKTSSKDAVFAVLSKAAYVRKSEKSYNSQIGLPLTILGVANAWGNPLLWFVNILKGLWLIIYPHKYPEWLVLEVGVGKPGDMAETASWLKSDIVVITAIGDTPVHIEFFNSRDHLVREKAELIDTLKDTGTLILNADDDTVLKMGEGKKKREFTYGFKESADLRASGDAIFYEEKVPAGMTFRVDVGGGSFPVTRLKVFGRNHIYSSLVALSVASVLKLNILDAIEALKDYAVPPGRMCLLRGIAESFIIDDTYNSSPFACVAALETLGGVNLKSSSKGRRIAVLGDMLELGKHTEEAHKEIGKIAKENADVLVLVGPRAQFMREGALEAGMLTENVFHFSTSGEAGDFLKNLVKKGDLVLIKGSQGVRMERAVEAIMADLSNKENLLVRQDKEWKNR